MGHVFYGLVGVIEDVDRDTNKKTTPVQRDGWHPS